MISTVLLDEVELALSPTEARTPAEVHRLVGCWARVTIRHALIRLCAEGRAVYDGENTRRRYRKATP